jgi:chromosome partitioning protein
MIRLVVSNQRGGVTKTTTTHTLARCFADQGLKVLMIDTDSQGSLSSVLGVNTQNHLHQFIVENYRWKDCIINVYSGIDILCSNRQTVETEGVLMGRMGREMTFQTIFPQVDHEYDVVLVDVAPSITLLQTCAMIYAQQLLIPVSMDPLSLQGAAAAIETANTLNKLFRLNIRPVAFLPVIVDRRLQMTDVILKSLDTLAAAHNIPVLQAIRTDTTPTKAQRTRQFLVDFDPKCKAIEDYQLAASQLLEHLRDQLSGKSLQLNGAAAV